MHTNVIQRQEPNASPFMGQNAKFAKLSSENDMAELVCILSMFIISAQSHLAAVPMKLIHTQI